MINRWLVNGANLHGAACAAVLTASLTFGCGISAQASATKIHVPTAVVSGAALCSADWDYRPGFLPANATLVGSDATVTIQPEHRIAVSARLSGSSTAIGLLLRQLFGDALCAGSASVFSVYDFIVADASGATDCFVLATPIRIIPAAITVGATATGVVAEGLVTRAATSDDSLSTVARFVASPRIKLSEESTWTEYPDTEPTVLSALAISQPLYLVRSTPLSVGICGVFAEAFPTVHAQVTFRCAGHIEICESIISPTLALGEAITGSMIADCYVDKRGFAQISGAALITLKPRMRYQAAAQAYSLMSSEVSATKINPGSTLFFFWVLMDGEALRLALPNSELIANSICTDAAPLMVYQAQATMSSSASSEADTVMHYPTATILAVGEELNVVASKLFFASAAVYVECTHGVVATRICLIDDIVGQPVSIKPTQPNAGGFNRLIFGGTTYPARKGQSAVAATATRICYSDGEAGATAQISSPPIILIVTADTPAVALATIPDMTVWINPHTEDPPWRTFNRPAVQIEFKRPFVNTTFKRGMPWDAGYRQATGFREAA